MLSIDIKTIILAIIIGNFFTVLLITSYNRQRESKTPSIELFIAAKWVQLSGWVFLILRNTVPDFFSIYIGNILTLAGGIIEMIAILYLLEIYNKKIKMSYILIMISFLISITFLYAAGVRDNYRIANISFFVTFMTIIPTYKLLRSKNPLHLMMGTMYGVTTLTLIIRAVYALTANTSLMLFTSNWIQTWSFLSLFLIMILGSNGFVLLAKEKADKELILLASNDDLTHILNRRTFILQAQKMIAMCTRKKTFITVMIIDIDNFKIINDSYGHDAGDAILQDFSEKILHSLRIYDIFGRYGGDEFSLLLPDTMLENALEIAERFRKNIEESPYKGSTEINYTISIGVASLLPDENTEFDKIFKQADLALYNAKNSGRNRVSS